MMKLTKKLLISCFILISIVSMLFALAACKTLKYELEDCSLRENSKTFTQKYSSDDFTVYFDSSVKKAKTQNEWIERFSEISSLLQEHNLDSAITYFVSDETVAECNMTADGDMQVYLPADISREESLAWTLSWKIGNTELPYGVYAGVAANWLNGKDDKFSVLEKSAITEAGYLTELQFPIYETDNLKKTDRKLAWNFSYTLVHDWLETGADENSLLQLSRADFESFLQSHYQISLPEYEFFPHSPAYEYRVIQGCFTYYINREFHDTILPEKYFTTSYDFLSDWLKDNWKTKLESDAVFHIDSMYDIKVNLDDGKNIAMSGEANKDYINIYSAGAFSHEYIHHILFKLGKSGNLMEVFPELHANDSKYSNLMWYYLLSGKSPTFPYNKEIDEKGLCKQAMKLYNKKSVEPASVEHFDFWLYADCFASLTVKEAGERFMFRAQPDSLVRWIATTYGPEIVWQLNIDTGILIDGKSFNEVKSEWRDYLKSGNFIV